MYNYIYTYNNYHSCIYNYKISTIQYLGLLLIIIISKVIKNDKLILTIYGCWSEKHEAER